MEVTPSLLCNFTALSVRKLFLISSLNLPWHNSRPLLLLMVFMFHTLHQFRAPSLNTLQPSLPVSSKIFFFFIQVTLLLSILSHLFFFTLIDKFGNEQKCFINLSFSGSPLVNMQKQIEFELSETLSVKVTPFLTDHSVMH